MNRRYWADATRVIASFMVVMIHVCGVGWYSMESSGSQWWTVNILDSLCRCCVPLFFMLSGALQLSREPTAGNIVQKALKLMLLWVLASGGYALLNEDAAELLTHPIYFLQVLLNSHYHLWFLSTMACIYLLIPVFKALVSYEKGKWVPWYLAVFFLFGIVRPSLNFIPVKHELWWALPRVMVPELCQYSGYFVLGWYLAQNDKKADKRICAAGIVLAAAVIAVGTHFWSLTGESNDERMYAYLSLPVFIQAVCAFLLAKELRPGKETKTVEALSKLTLGIYLIHPAVIDVLAGVGISVFKMHRIASVPLVAALSFVLSAVCAWLLRKIPIIKKLL